MTAFMSLEQTVDKQQKIIIEIMEDNIWKFEQFLLQEKSVQYKQNWLQESPALVPGLPLWEEATEAWGTLIFTRTR